MIAILLVLQNPQNLEEEVLGEAEYEIEVYPKPFVSYPYDPTRDINRILVMEGEDSLARQIVRLRSNLDLMADSSSIARAIERLNAGEDLYPILMTAFLYLKGYFASASDMAFALINSDISDIYRSIIYRLYAISSLNAGKYGQVSTMFLPSLEEGALSDSIVVWAVAEDIYYRGDYVRSERIQSRNYSSRDMKLSSLALYGGGWSSLHIGKYSEALGLFRKGEARARRPVVLNLIKIGEAVALFNMGNRQEALSIILSVDEGAIPPESRRELLYYRGLIAYYNRQDDRAIKDFSEFVQEFPTDRRAAFVALKLSDLYRFSGNYKEAIANLEWIVANFGRIPEKENALYLLGELYYSQEDYELALHRYLQLIEEFSSSDYIPAARIRVEQILTRLAIEDEKYIEVFERYFPDSPKLVDVYYYWGSKYFQEGNLEKAAEYFYKLALKFPKNPKAPEALFTAGQIYMKLGKYADAAEVFKRLLNLYPDFSKRGEAYANVGVSMVNEGRVMEAIRYLENALRREADRLSEYDKAVIYMYLGLAYEKGGNLQKAREYLERARNQFFAIGRVDKLEEVNRYLDALPR